LNVGICDADVLAKFANGFSVVQERSICGEESARSIWHGKMIQVVQLAIVFETNRVLLVQVRTAKEFVFYLASALTRRLAARQKFLIDVKVDVYVLSDPVL